MENFLRPRRADAVAPGCTKTELVPSLHDQPCSAHSCGNSGSRHAMPWSPESKWTPSLQLACTAPLLPVRAVGGVTLLSMKA